MMMRRMATNASSQLLALEDVLGANVSGKRSLVGGVAAKSA